MKPVLSCVFDLIQSKIGFLVQFFKGSSIVGSTGDAHRCGNGDFLVTVTVGLAEGLTQALNGSGNTVKGIDDIDAGIVFMDKT